MASPTKYTGFRSIPFLYLLVVILLIVNPAADSTTDPPSMLSTATSGNTATTTIQSSTATSGNTTTTQPSSSTTGTSAQNSTTTSEDNMHGINATHPLRMMYCPSLNCSLSECHIMYDNHTDTPCSADRYCQLMRHGTMHHVSCSPFCGDICMNTTQTNCTVKCCNFTGCLNGSFPYMTVMTTVTPNSTSTAPTTTMTTSPHTTANNGMKCHHGVCTDGDCYTTFKTQALQICSSSEKHCQLKKETVNSKVQWTASCTANCSAETPCKSTTQPPCHLECCNATLTSCLWLNGTLNVPSHATRGPYLHTELITWLLCLLTITLLLC